MPLDKTVNGGDDKVPIGDIITPEMRAAGVAAYCNCPTKHVETRCVAIFVAMMQKYVEVKGDTA